MTQPPRDQYHASRNNNNIVITSRNTNTNLVVLLCRCLALTSCLFPFSTLSVVSNASSYNRSVSDACDVNCVISSFCRAEISSNAFSVPLISLTKYAKNKEFWERNILYLVHCPFKSFQHGIVFLFQGL